MAFFLHEFYEEYFKFKIIFVCVENLKTDTANAWISHKKKDTL